MQSRSAARHTRQHTFSRKHEDPLFTVLSVIPHWATRANMLHVQVQRKSARLHCPPTPPPAETSALSDFIRRPESLAALPHTLDMHHPLASGKRYWFLPSTAPRLTASFPRLIEPSLHPHLHLPAQFRPQLIPTTRTRTRSKQTSKTRSVNHVSCRDLIKFPLSFILTGFSLPFLKSALFLWDLLDPKLLKPVHCSLFTDNVDSDNKATSICKKRPLLIGFIHFKVFRLSIRPFSRPACSWAQGCRVGWSYPRCHWLAPSKAFQSARSLNHHWAADIELSIKTKDR